jgi:hypothetical protein
MTNDEGMTKAEDRNSHFDNSFWDDGAGVVREEPGTKRVYDLEERTARFGEGIIDFAKTIPQNPVTNRIIAQLVGAGTSVGANSVEADDAVSKKDFLKSIGTCRKEARETQAFSSDDGSGGAATEAPNSSALARGKGTASDLLQKSGETSNRTNRDANVRSPQSWLASSFWLYYSFVIRH